MSLLWTPELGRLETAERERVEEARVRFNETCPDGKSHEKVFSGFRNDSVPPLHHWICARCRRRDYDRGPRENPPADPGRYRALGGTGPS